MRVLSLGFALSTLVVSTGCDRAVADERLSTSNLSEAPAAALIELQAETETAPEAVSKPRVRQSRARVEPVSYRTEPAYVPQPQVVKKTNIKRDAAIGAAAGATIGAIAHDRNRVKGAIVGGVVGGAAGAIVGATVDAKETVIYR